MKKVYLDYLASTPVPKEVVDAMLPYFYDNFGNPQSRHEYGNEPKRAIDEARAKVADLIGAEPSEIYFTSSGTEANNLAIKGIASAHSKKGKHIIVSSIEHNSILHSTKRLEKEGFEVTKIPVDNNGQVNPDDIAKNIREDTILVSVMHANNEIGTIEPISEIGRITEEKGVNFHTDAIGSAGLLPIDVNELNVDLMSLSSQQMYGPKGVGVLYIKKNVRITPLLDGGIQESGKRAGTENVAGIVGMGKAAEIAKRELYDGLKKTTDLRDRLIKGLEENIEYLYLTGDRVRRLPNVVSFCVEYIEGEAMTLLLSEAGVFASSGSTCSSHALKASQVLLAIGISPAIAQGSILFSLGRETTEEDIDHVIKSFPPIVKKLRDMSPLYEDMLKQKAGK